jgi:hypothetical protein
MSVDKISALSYSSHLDKMNCYQPITAKSLRHEVVRGWIFARRGLKAG